jgi:hypothetical protein
MSTMSFPSTPSGTQSWNPTRMTVQIYSILSLSEIRKSDYRQYKINTLSQKLWVFFYLWSEELITLRSALPRSSKSLLGSREILFTIEINSETSGISHSPLYAIFFSLVIQISKFPSRVLCPLFASTVSGGRNFE